jgi:hypothetical protein
MTLPHGDGPGSPGSGAACGGIRARAEELLEEIAETGSFEVEVESTGTIGGTCAPAGCALG